jgi:hypothetical protein
VIPIGPVHGDRSVVIASYNEPLLYSEISEPSQLALEEPEL